MAVAILLIAIGVGLWALLLLPRASLPLLAMGAVIVGYVFGHSFWNIDLGPLPLTFDRLLLIAMAGLFCWRLRSGQIEQSAVSAVDWALALMLVWLTGSALLNRPGEEVNLPTSPLWRLLVSFWAPAALFVVTRQSKLPGKTIHYLLAALALLGGYLSLTALAETAGAWAVVFPRYIANPELGLHFGRARGPALNSVSLGTYLGICLWSAWALLPLVPRWAKSLLLFALPLMVLGVLLTYTRSTWLGLAGSGMAVLALELPKRLRLPVLTGVSIAGVLMAAALWQSVLQLEREDSGGVSQHSVQQRAAFAYVSMNMFRDNPLWGVGFGRFYDQKLPYLSDRSQAFELESIRDLHHHNTFLSLLTETGMVGLFAYAALLLGLLAAGWRLASSDRVPAEQRRLGLLLVAAVMVYLPSALFHDLTHVHADQWLLFLVAGLGVGCERRTVAASTLLAATEQVAEAPKPGFSSRPLASPSI